MTALELLMVGQATILVLGLANAVAARKRHAELLAIHGARVGDNPRRKQPVKLPCGCLDVCTNQRDHGPVNVLGFTDADHAGRMAIEERLAP